MANFYTFRYLAADGRIQRMIFVELPDLKSAEGRAYHLMPDDTVSVEIWREDDLVCKRLRQEVTESAGSADAAAGR